MKRSLKSISLIIIALIIAAVGLTACSGDINEDKESAKETLTQVFTSYKESDYSSENWVILVAAKDSGLENIEAATTAAEIKKAKNDAILAMAAVISKAGEAQFEIAKAAAIAELEENFALYKQADYSATNWLALNTAIETGKTNINASKSIAALNTAKQNAILALGEVATLKQLYEVGSQTEFNNALTFGTEEIKLTSDIVLIDTIAVSTNLKIDLNGYTMSKIGGLAISISGTAKVTLGGGNIEVTDGSVIKVDGVNAELTILDGTYTSQYQSAANNELLIVLNLQNGAKATVKGGEFDASGVYTDSLFVAQAMKSATNSKLTVDNATITSNQYGISITDGGSLQFNDGSITTNWQGITTDWQGIAPNNTKPTASIDINGGTITSTDSVAIYMPAQGTLSIDGATVTGLTALDIRMGTITIGATAIINATGEEVVLTKNIESTEPDGSAILINRNLFEKQTAPNNDLNLTIASGATITATSGNEITSYNWKTVDQTVTMQLGDYSLSYDYNYNSSSSVLYQLDVATEAELDTALANMADGDIIKLKSNITITTKKNITQPITIKIDLKSKTIDSIIDENLSRLFALDNADAVLEVYNGVINAAGSGTTKEDGAGAYGTFFVNKGKLIARDLILKNYRPWGLNVKLAKGSEAILTNVQIISSYGGGLEAAGSTVELNNCQITQTGVFDHCSSTVSVSNGGTVTINGGKYYGEKYSVYVFDSGGTVNINGGDYKAAIVLKADAVDSTTVSIINITAGTFEGEEQKASNATITHPTTTE